MNGFNIDTLAAAPSASLILLHPATQEPLAGPDGPATIDHYAPGSPEYAKAKAKQSDRWLGRLNKRGGKAKQLSAAELDESKADFLADITIGFNNFASQKYQHLSGRDYHHALYADPAYGFIVEQFDEQLGDYANFLTTSAKN
ncbi:hypothetical protein [uncultured Sphingomonas sp.]|uniref:hypothetical protein n=1 Tax=uncultured Sphingomonas sp. TaxID=158754 RepID=UPI0025E9BBE3|nr:hypothetical protein [uncultured Sphingomonas sp.]